MNPEAKFATLRAMFVARESRAAKVEAALIEENGALRQCLDQILARVPSSEASDEAQA